MVQTVTVGLDIAENVFHAYAVGADGQRVFSRKLRCTQVEGFFSKLKPCLIGIEACATAPSLGPHVRRHGARGLAYTSRVREALGETQKYDEADAEAIRKTITRPNMRFAEIKTVDQQSILVLHRTGCRPHMG